MAKSANRGRLRQLVKNQGGRCFYCKYPIEVMAGTGRKFVVSLLVDTATYDHIVPVSTGSTRNSPGVAACPYCNSKRQHRPFNLWLEHSQQDFYRDSIEKVRTKTICKAVMFGRIEVPKEHHQFIEL